MESVTVCITGASGTVYGKRIVEVLTANGYMVNLIFSRNGERVFEFETGVSKGDFLKSLPGDLINVFDVDDLFAPISSGSHRTKGVIVSPCSAGTLGAAASGISRNLIHRVIDVSLKERRKVLLIFRETPINRIHMENMLRLSSSGAIIMPASPGFYTKPKTVDDMVNFIVGKALNLFLEKDIGLFEPWNP